MKCVKMRRKNIDGLLLWCEETDIPGQDVVTGRFCAMNLFLCVIHEDTQSFSYTECMVWGLFLLIGSNFLFANGRWKIFYF